jgi:phosphoglycolate phosphatase-like HAD superfamily hydrolase
MAAIETEPLTALKYWRRKRSGCKTPGLLGPGAGKTAAAQYDRAFHSVIEAKPLLASDCLHPGALGWLERAHRGGARVVVVTGRHDPLLTREQFNALGLSTFELVIAPNEEKALIVQQHLALRPLVWIGDTELDIAAAQTLQTTAVGVSSGLRSARFLRSSGADVVVPSLARVVLEC